MSRGPGTHQREILQRLETQGWIWFTDLPHRNRSDMSAWYRAATRLEALGQLRFAYRHRRGFLREWLLLVSVNQSPRGTDLPLPKCEPMFEGGVPCRFHWRQRGHVPPDTAT